MRAGILAVGVALLVGGMLSWGSFYLDEQQNRQFPTGSSGAFIGTDRLFGTISLVVAGIGGLLVLLGSALKAHTGITLPYDDDRSVR